GATAGRKSAKAVRSSQREAATASCESRSTKAWPSARRTAAARSIVGAPGVGPTLRSCASGTVGGSAGSSTGRAAAGASGFAWIRAPCAAAATAQPAKTATSTAWRALVTSRACLLRPRERGDELLEQQRVVALDPPGQEVRRTELVLAAPDVEEELGRRLEEAVGVLVLAFLDGALVLADVHRPLLVVAEREVVGARRLHARLVEALGQALEDLGDLAHARPSSSARGSSLM